MKEHRLEVPAHLELVPTLHSTSLANLQLDYCLPKHSLLDLGGFADPYDLPFSKDPVLILTPLLPQRTKPLKLLIQHLVGVDFQQLDPSPPGFGLVTRAWRAPTTEYLKWGD